MLLTLLGPTTVYTKTKHLLVEAERGLSSVFDLVGPKRRVRMDYFEVLISER